MNEIKDVVASVPLPSFNALVGLALAITIAIYLKLPQTARAMIGASGDLVSQLQKMNTELREELEEVHQEQERMREDHALEIAELRREHLDEMGALQDNHNLAMRYLRKDLNRAERAREEGEKECDRRIRELEQRLPGGAK